VTISAMFKLVWGPSSAVIVPIDSRHSNSNSKGVGTESYLGTPSSKLYDVLLRFVTEV
jgi:hypothetical protein